MAGLYSIIDVVLVIKKTFQILIDESVATVQKFHNVI